MSYPLSEVFATFARAELPLQWLAAGGLESHLQAVAQRARLAWPDLALPETAFVEHVAPRLVHAISEQASDPDALVQALGRLHAADLYLACACLRGNKLAAEVLDRDFLGQIPHLIAHMRLSKQELEDIRQALGERLFIGGADGRPRLAEYAGQGALLSWIRIAALRSALDRRRRQRHESVDQDPAQLAGTVADRRDLQQEYLKERYHQHFEDALRTALSQLSAEQRNVLRLHFIDGLSIDRIGALFKIHRATAARWIASARLALLQDVRVQLAAQLKLSTSEFESIAKLVRSQLHLSLHRFLRDPSGTDGTSGTSK